MTASSAGAATVRIYIDAQPVDADAGVTALDALQRHDPAAAALVRKGDRVMVDDRGLPAALGQRITNGSIFRIVSSKQAS